MKFRTIKYFIKEGMVNIYKQAMMSIATISIIVASYIVLGIFIFMIINLNNVAKVMSNEPEISVFCIVDIDDAQIANIEVELNKVPEIQTVVKVTYEEAMQKIKSDFFKGNEDLLNGMNPSEFLPTSFTIKLKNSKDVEKVLPILTSIQGVDKANSPLDIVNIIIKFQNGIKLITFLLMLILFGISIMIISNAIKLTVHSRKREINIMKYVGATDAFIRWPFIVEGLIMGIIGSAVAFVFVSFLYNWIANSAGPVDKSIFSDVKIIELYDKMPISIFGLFHIEMFVGIFILVLFVFSGMLMGAAGSALAVRRYLKV